MNIDKLSKEYDIAPTVHALVNLISESTGKKIEFELLINLDTDGITKIAREKMPKHIIKVKENSTARVNHIIVHECCHILRVMQAQPSQRVIPSTNTRTTEKAFDALKSELSAVPARVRDEIFKLWVSGIVNQLVNLPVDVRVEKWLYENYPEFRDIQNKSVEMDVENCLLGLSDQVRNNTIESIFKKSNAMVYAYLKGVSSITGKDYGSEFEPYKDIALLGEALYACFEPEDKGYTQDVETINKWAKLLDIEGWFTWIGFEEVPGSYYE